MQQGQSPGKKNPLQPLFGRNVEDIVVFLVLKMFISDNFHMFSCSRNALVTFVAKPEWKILFFKIKNIDIVKVSKNYLFMKYNKNIQN